MVGEAGISLMLFAWYIPLLGGTAYEIWAFATGRTTISRYVWDHPTSGVPIIIYLMILPAFLAGHFWLGWFRGD